MVGVELIPSGNWELETGVEACMNLSRRGFLGGGAALFGSVAAAGAAKSARHDGPPRLKIGVIADPHVGTKWMMGINAPATEKAFRQIRPTQFSLRATFPLLCSIQDWTPLRTRLR